MEDASLGFAQDEMSRISSASRLDKDKAETYKACVGCNLNFNP